MALTALIPKSWRPKHDGDPTTGPSTPSSNSTPASSSSASSSTITTTTTSSNRFSSDADPSLAGLPGRDAEGRRKIPPVALYVSGAAFALTIAMTAMVIPFVKQAQTAVKPIPTFLSHSHTDRPLISVIRKGAKSPHTSLAPFSKSASASSTPTSASTSPSAPSAPLQSSPSPTPTQHSQIPASNLSNPSVSAVLSGAQEEVNEDTASARAFNTQEEQRLFGHEELEGGGNPRDSPLVAFGALGVATAVVGLSAGLGGWAVARFMGVQSIDEFTQRMREGLLSSMPVLSQKISEAKDNERKVLGENVMEGKMSQSDLEVLIGSWMKEETQPKPS